MQGRKTAKPYGTWPAPVSAQLVTRGAPSLNHVQSNGDLLFWVESRPWEAGRNVIMCRSAEGSLRDLLPAGFSHHSRVHEYGGMAYAVTENWLYFVNGPDQCIYRVDLKNNRDPEPITAPGLRFADLVVDQQNQQLIAVCEEHREGREAENYLVAISLNAHQPDIRTLVSGADFYAYPNISPDGQKLCWIEWNHPHMPWDCTQLWQAKISEQGLANRILVAGGDNNEAIFQPRWSPDNQLYFVSDRDNWWNIHRADRGIVFAMAAEFATPLWQFGMSTYDFIDADTLGCLWTQQGVWYCGFITITTGELTRIDCDYTSMHAACCHQGRLSVVAGAPTIADQVVEIDPWGCAAAVYAPSNLDLDAGDLARPESINFSTADGQSVQAFFYLPTNSIYQSEENELPPLIVICHGGPTGATDSGLNLKIQYWTNRGFAVVDINYRGSTGFGRAYRHSLATAWGIADVQDTQYAVNYLIEQQRVDPQRCIIRGGSAGGYTVLSALTFTDSFKAGASLYGIGDLETLAKDTHKFESRYLDKLVGPYPEKKHIYQQRSPIHHAQKLNCPVIFLQGLEDKVVPPNQAEMMVNILEHKGIEVDHIRFPDEGHGFRKADNIIRALEAELAFYRRVFKLGKEQ
jgi:dipeptidyl aminopeptidase/acylaminoacyl peptidase